MRDSTSTVDPSPAARQGLRRYIAWAVLIAVAALGLGVALLPKGEELFLIYVRNRDVASAEQLLATNVAGGPAVASVVARGELHTLEGRIDQAVADAEAYTAAHPGELAAWTHLANLYAEAQRSSDWTRALGEIYRLQPTPERARAVATRHRRSGDARAEGEVLAWLLNTGQATDSELLRSAQVHAAAGRFDLSRQALAVLERRNPGAFDYPALELYASVLTETDATDRLAPVVQAMPLAGSEPASVALIADALRRWGHVDASVAVVRPVPGMPARPEFQTAWAAMARGTRHAPAVARELSAIDATTRLAAEPSRELVALAVSINAFDLLERLFDNHGADRNPAHVGLAIGQAVKTGDRAQAQRFIARFGDDGLADSPLLALDLAVARGDAVSADRWIARLDASPATSPAEMASIAKFEVALGRPDAAFTRLVTTAKTGRAPAWSLSDLSTLAEARNRVTEALTVLADLASRSADARRAWAALAVRTGRFDLVDAWADRVTAVSEAPALRDTYYAYSDRRDAPRALRVARRLHAVVHPSAVAQFFGRRQARPDTAIQLETTAIYEAALHAAQAAGEDVNLEVREVFSRRLADPDLPPDQHALLVEGLWRAGERGPLHDHIVRLARTDLARWLSPLVESSLAFGQPRPAVDLVRDALAQAPTGDRADELIFALLSLNAPDDAVMPYLEPLATSRGGSWAHAYDDRLARAGQTAARIDLWARVGEAELSTFDDRRAAAARLHELGATSRAAAILERLAENAGPADADLAVLLSLWGTSAPAAGRAWLVQRLMRATEGDQAAWIGHLVYAGGARNVTAALPALSASAPVPVVQAWIEAHRVAGDRAGLERALASRVSNRAGAEERVLVARAAYADGFMDLAARAYEAVVEQDASHLEAKRVLGALSYAAGRWTAAQAWLAAYEGGGGDDPEPLFQLGEMARSAGDLNRARRYYTRARARLETAPNDAVRGTLLANVLLRLDDRDGARRQFDAWVDRDTASLDTRADYVVALLAWGDDARAGQVLGPAGSRLSSKRLDLLRAEWLGRQGRYAEAERTLADVVLRHPSDPDALVARGAFELSVGRLVEADASFEAARRFAPDREDIARYLADRRDGRRPLVTMGAAERTVSSGWSEQSSRLAMGAFVRPDVGVSMTIERVHTIAPVMLFDGRQLMADEGAARVELGITGYLRSGLALFGSLYGARQGLGAGGAIRRHDLLGAWTVLGEWGRPFWEFAESAVAGGRRDRLAVERQLRFGNRTAAWAHAGWNRYRLDRGPALSTFTIAAGVSRAVWPRVPSLYVQYGLDVERRLATQPVAASDAGSALRLPLTNREVHAIGMGNRSRWMRWDLDATAGVTVDRFGGRGPFWTFRVTPVAGSRLGVEAWADWRLHGMATTARARQAGAALRVGF